MSNYFGKQLTVSIFGESHGPAIGVVISGLAAGIPLDLDLIRQQLALRRPQGRISTARQEQDEFELLSGYFQGHTTGTPLTICIPNRAQSSKDYEKTKYLLRPGHADFTAFEKYGGYQDYRGGGHFSGRLTAPLVAAGAVCRQLLQNHGILIGTHLECCGGIADATFAQDVAVCQKQVETLNQQYFPTISESQGEAMQQAILAAQRQGDSVGGILETVVLGMPTGIGEPFFDSIESTLAHLLFSIPGVKGVSFGLGFDFAAQKGSVANDAFFMEQGNIRTKTNHNGGVNGGISNGMPIVIHSVVKPTPSIYQKQNTVDYQKKTDATLQIVGRHDPAIIHRARVVADSMVAIGLVDLCCQRFGVAWQLSNQAK